MTAWQSVRMVTSPSVWFLAAANLQRSREGPALGVIGFLAPAHVGLVALPRLAVFPDDGVSSYSVLQPTAVLRRKANLSCELSELLRVSSLLHPYVVVVLQGQLGVEPDS